MQTKFFYCVIVMVLLSNVLFSQIVYERSDYHNAGDKCPIVNYTNTYETQSLPFSNFYTDEIFRIAQNTGFENCIMDTIYYYEPADFDNESNFPEANCLYINDLGFEVFVKISDTQVQEIGLKGILPFANLPYSLTASNPLTTLYFPAQVGSVIEDTGYLNQKFLISDFESIIPPDDYPTIAAIFDTVNVQVEISVHSEFENEIQLVIQDTNAFNATRQVLTEYKRDIYIMDILLRNKLSNQYISLGSVPGIGDMIPIDFPIIDTSYYFNCYAKTYGTPLLHCAINQERSMIFSMRVYNDNNSSIPNYIDDFTVNLFPNPANNILNFYFDKPQKGVLSILNIEGKLMSEMEFNTKNIIFDAAKFDSGFYIYMIKTNTGKLNIGKFQVLR
ncbi:MAG TPA: T9SS type A sorting domain-containing protein [Bacteroidales bacterium]|nr:T9SS type A sorting domain-containing protein [Bacteroidales bacterium]HRW20370.1 T9SS type A sorting domain-containing protein [Bacteroidales bacterium]HXK80999.1 T9SS type A sorting domain-containing protein [Bacteroidales bacterium]